MFEANRNNSQFKKTISTLKKRLCKIYSYRYQSDKAEHHVKLVNEIIFNEKVLIVAKFKDYLILDDNSEFLKRYYISIIKGFIQDTSQRIV